PRRRHPRDLDLRLQHGVPVHPVRPGGGDAGLPPDHADAAHDRGRAHAAEGVPVSGGRGWRVGLFTVIVLILVVALFPFWWMINTSFKQQADIFGGVTLYPHNPTTANYERLFNTYHFADYLQNSIIVVTITVVISLVLGTLAAYPLARFRLR